ncbi:MAG TPA: GNAT family N-acetyltransferase [Gammaproteobacteria bacterium]|nr:GNAT family N-acetyltransferase [Gammaproteobacteria bacterium]
MLDFLPIDREMASALTSADVFQQRYGLEAEAALDLLRTVVQQTVERVLPVGGWGYVASEGALRRVVGTCGYRAAPDARGEVEIAYFTFPAFEGRGIATAMAKRLVEEAAGHRGVRLIIAHTLPRENASTRILTNLGFRHAGRVKHPEDGEIWRWERAPQA